MMRRVGVEEEFLIVNNADGQAVALGEVLGHLNDDDGLSGPVKQERTGTGPLPPISLAELAQHITSQPLTADSTARSVGAHATDWPRENCRFDMGTTNPCRTEAVISASGDGISVVREEPHRSQ